MPKMHNKLLRNLAHNYQRHGSRTALLAAIALILAGFGELLMAYYRFDIAHLSWLLSLIAIFICLLSAILPCACGYHTRKLAPPKATRLSSTIEKNATMVPLGLASLTLILVTFFGLPNTQVLLPVVGSGMVIFGAFIIILVVTGKADRFLVERVIVTAADLNAKELESKTEEELNGLIQTALAIGQYDQADIISKVVLNKVSDLEATDLMGATEEKEGQ